jgi:predicted RNase H-like HicB family nuclease
MRHKVLEYNAIFQKESEGGYSVWIPSLPGCASQGETFEDALENIKEAIGLYLEDEAEESVQESYDVRNQFMVPVRLTI